MLYGETDNRPLIAWVEDDLDLHKIVRSWLEPRYNVLIYSDGWAFWEALDTMTPDLIMLDVLLPGPDGFTLCRKVRNRVNIGFLPVLFLTGCSEDVTFMKHLEVGGSAYLEKPINKKLLLSKVRELI